MRQLVPRAVLAVALPALVATPAPATWSFTDVTTAAGVRFEHGYVGGLTSNPRQMAAGVAAGDYDGDGWTDLFMVSGDLAANRLFRNLGDGTFQDVAAAAGVATVGLGCGPVFTDHDGDGHLDLFVGGIDSTPPSLFRNQGDGTFANVTGSSGLTPTHPTFSASFGDYDGNGTLDLFASHWGVHQTLSPQHLWRNEGDGTFEPVDAAAGLTDWGPDILDWTFTGNFCDVDDDGDLDVLVVSDYNTSRVFRNDGGGAFANVSSPVLTDQHGMGAAVGDYDNDGDLDWFVTSILNTSAGLTGNRLYRNDGGSFADVTDAAGVRNGAWGWGASFADLDNDGHLDLIHVNGWYHPSFQSDATRLFVSNGDGTFTESAAALGCADTGQGRGLACVDHDRDGDLDLMLANNSGENRFYRNDLAEGNHWLQVRLADAGPNTLGIGARILVSSGGVIRRRDVRCGSNFVSADPLVQHFGLGASTTVDAVRVDWPDGGVTMLEDVAVDQRLVIDRTATAAPVASGGAGGVVSPNPFRGRTTLSFATDRPGTGRLRVHDAAGRRLLDRAIELRRGENRVEWDGRDADGRPAPAGVYFLGVEGPAGTAHGRAVRLR
ncbi:MAG TPA: FG-GAP-like repeat-containing protein [bacterium]|nr:FG-GAP-like repeat-containing protein [bacterium]